MYHHCDAMKGEAPLCVASKVRQGYSDGGVIPTVVLISPAYCAGP